MSSTLKTKIYLAGAGGAPQVILRSAGNGT